MNINKKVLVAIVLACIAMSSGLTYALIIKTVTVHNQITILGGALDLWKKNPDETYTTEYTTENLGEISVTGVTIESPMLVLVSDFANTVKFVLKFNDTLPSNVGVIVWQIEVRIVKEGYESWVWFDWTETQIQCSEGYNMYLPGTPNNPLQPGQKLGLRPATPVLRDTGHFRYVLILSSTAPCGSFPFDMTINGTQA